MIKHLRTSSALHGLLILALLCQALLPSGVMLQRPVDETAGAWLVMCTGSGALRYQQLDPETGGLSPALSHAEYLAQIDDAPTPGDQSGGLCNFAVLGMAALPAVDTLQAPRFAVSFSEALPMPPAARVHLASAPLPARGPPGVA